MTLRNYVSTVPQPVRKNLDFINSPRDSLMFAKTREIVVKFSRDYSKFDNKQQRKKISSPPKYIR